MSTLTANPDFASADFLKSHIRQTLDFYFPRAIDREAGGFFNAYAVDGTIYDRHVRHIVGMTRFTYIASVGTALFDDPVLRGAVDHGLDFLETAQRDPVSRGYAWALRDRTVVDGSLKAYGHAFVLLAHSVAARLAGAKGARIADVADLIVERFIEGPEQLALEAYDAGWTNPDTYRGQNANMHLCEAMIAAYEATGDKVYIERAAHIARRIAIDFPADNGGFIHEHFTSDWKVDREAARRANDHTFRPEGFQPGHHAEWCKLLLTLYRLTGEEIYKTRSVEIFDLAVAPFWDEARGGGFYYTFDEALQPIDKDKHHWLVSESFSAAFLLYKATGEARFLDWYNKIWTWTWAYMIDRERGGWYVRVDENNQRYPDDPKSPPYKTDYHAISNCYEVLRALGAAE